MMELLGQVPSWITFQEKERVTVSLSPMSSKLTISGLTTKFQKKASLVIALHIRHKVARKRLHQSA